MPASERVPPGGLTSGGGPAPEGTQAPADPVPAELVPAEPASAEPVPVVDGAPVASRADHAADLDLLTRGELAVRGRVREASNAVLYCEVALDGRRAHCVYKPVEGERPLWDFPDGSLAAREVAAYLVSRATGWDLVPPTVLREGPYGTGMCQLWIDAVEDGRPLLALVEREEPEPGWKAVVAARTEDGRDVLLVHADDERLRRVAVLDAVINNADRKGGHLLPAAGGRLYGIDHGVTFHTDDKLRTLLWGWAGDRLTADARAALDRLRGALDGDLGAALAGLLAEEETAALRARVTGLLEADRHPLPSDNWPAIPWPPL